MVYQTENLHRIAFISFFRVVACIMVVYYHCICLYIPAWNTNNMVDGYIVIGNIINSIDMPIFFILSGYLYSYSYNKKNKYKDVYKLIKGKCVRLILPYLFWGIFICLIMPDKYHIIQMAKGISHLWFLLVLNNLFLLTACYRKFWLSLTIRNLLLIISFSLIVFCLGTYFPFISSWLCFNTTMQYLPIFAIGLWCGYNNIPNISKNKIVCVGFLFLIVVISSNNILNKLNYLLASIIVVYLLKKIQNLNIKVSSWIASIDKNSMGIYILHHILIVWLLQYDSIKLIMIEYIYVAPVLMFLLVFSISFFLTCVIRKSNNYLSVLIG